MNKVFQIFASVFLLYPCLALSQIDPGLPDLGEPFDQEINFNAIRSAFSSGNYDMAFNLSIELAYEKARQALLDKKNLKIIIRKLAEGLQELINNPNMTNEEKGEEVARMIAASLEPYEYVVSDQLNTSIKHSIEYGTTFLTWDDKTEFSKCYGLYVKSVMKTVCDYWGCHDEWVDVYEYRDEYLTQVPDYYIYRIVDGEQKLISKIKGYKNVSFKTYGLSPEDGWSGLAKNAFDYFRNTPEANVEEGRLFWFDLHADIRNMGETLSYRVEADLKPYRGVDCGSKNKYASTIVADSDGDGKMDYIPESAYQKYFGKYYGWLVPVITLLN